MAGPLETSAKLRDREAPLRTMGFSASVNLDRSRDGTRDRTALLDRARLNRASWVHRTMSHVRKRAAATVAAGRDFRRCRRAHRLNQLLNQRVRQPDRNR